MWLTLPRTSLGFRVQLSFWVKWVCCCVFFQDNWGSTFLCVGYFISLHFILFHFKSNLGSTFFGVWLCAFLEQFSSTQIHTQRISILSQIDHHGNEYHPFGDNYYSPVLFIRCGASQVLFSFFAMSQFELAHHSKKLETMEAPQHRRFYFEVQSASLLGSQCLDCITLLLELILICTIMWHIEIQAWYLTDLELNFRSAQH